MYNFHWAGTVIQCFKRRYTMATFLHSPSKPSIHSIPYSKLEREDVEMADCKGTFIDTDASRAYLLLRGTYEIMDFMKNGDTLGKSVIETSFKTEANLKLRCQTDTDVPAKDSAMAEGFIMYEDIILDKLYLDSCTAGVEGIYINVMNEKDTKAIRRIFTCV
ncbi:uncharacterized protein LOC128983450 [Macrosteles quadrilineatus]|uniref:uncharacterized protein LOC128983450 n=1 Tax=Macrosteles quadrilineatus TaxID=74068 RepID=UPI0023E24E3E|nr:uncharacterized protein LOC128983450 [Macrosteles quadrilineatus]